MNKEREILIKAMFHSFNEFQKYIEDIGIEPSFFSLYLTGYVLDDNCEKSEEVKLNLNRTGKETFEHPDKQEAK